MLIDDDDIHIGSSDTPAYDRNTYCLPLEYDARLALGFPDRDMVYGTDADGFESDTVGTMIKVLKMLEEDRNIYPQTSEAFEKDFGTYAGRPIHELTNQSELEDILKQAIKRFEADLKSLEVKVYNR